MARTKTNKVNVFEFITNAIFHGELRAGTIISEEWLGKNLNVSRTPVREALIHLKAEGLIQLVNGRATVTTITPVDIQEIYELRILLEPYAARICIGLIDKDEVQKIRDYTQRMLKKISGSDFNRTSDIHEFIVGKTFENRYYVQGLMKREITDQDRYIHDIHDLIIACTRNQRLGNITRNLQSQTNLLLHTAAQIPGRIIQSLEEHLCIIDAILTNDPAMAETHMRTHIQTNMKDMLDSDNFLLIFKM